MTKITLKRKDTYQTHVCRQPWSVENSERTDKKQELGEVD